MWGAIAYIQNHQLEVLEITNLRIEIKNSAYGLNIRIDRTKEQITKLRYGTNGFSQNKARKATEVESKKKVERWRMNPTRSRKRGKLKWRISTQERSQWEKGESFAPASLCVLQGIKAESWETAGREEPDPRQGQLLACMLLASLCWVMSVL